MTRSASAHGTVLAAAVLLGLLIAGGALSAALATAPADAPKAAPKSAPTCDRDLMDLSIDQLMNVNVTSASKKEQKLADVPAAMHVLTSEDLRRSGARNLPEALRLVPGLQVARIDANKWAISARGFNDRFANKMLVLVDGRSTYTNLFSGVFWEAHDIPFDTIDRIEVIRGPGATVWGANAVNGVVNIITKSARDTQGVQVLTGGGSTEHAFVNALAGRAVGSSSWVRLNASFADRSNGWAPRGQQAYDNWTTGRFGFRFDGRSGANDEFYLVGDALNSRLSSLTTMPQLTAPYSSTIRSRDPFHDQSLLGRWTHRYHSSGEMSLQTYFDHTALDVQALLALQSRVFDAEFVNRIHLGSRNEVVSGIEFRSTADRADTNSAAQLRPASRTSRLLSAFLEDELSLLDRKLVMTTGSKFEHNQVTGWEIQPNIRLMAHKSERHTFWAAASRAVRTPSVVDESLDYLYAVMPPNAVSPGAPACAISVVGTSNVRSEDLLAFDLGYRSRLQENLAVDLATFSNRYDHLRGNEMGQPSLKIMDGQPFLAIPVQITNQAYATTYGTELAVDYRPHRLCRLEASYTYLMLTKKYKSGHAQGTSGGEGTMDPRNQFVLRSSFDPTTALESDITVRYVSGLRGDAVPGYLVGDLHLEYKWSPELSAGISVQNLGQSHHLEFLPQNLNTAPTEVSTGVTGSLRWSL
jgi:iron complex outermembrane recepter protein